MKLHQHEDSVTIDVDDPQDRVYIGILFDAISIYAERKAKRGGGWRRYGFNGAAFFLKDRANRVWDACRLRGTFEREDAIDVLNYSIIAIMSLEENNFGGEFWPEDSYPMSGVEAKVGDPNFCEHDWRPMYKETGDNEPSMYFCNYCKSTRPVEFLEGRSWPKSASEGR
jgi:hypothetical protein